MNHFDPESVLEDTDLYSLNHELVRKDAIAIYRANPTEEGLREADKFWMSVYQEWADEVITQVTANLMKLTRNRHEARKFGKLVPRYAKHVRGEMSKLRQMMFVEAVGKHVTNEQIAAGKFADLLKDALA